MIFDWRPSFVRGGSGWVQSGLVSVSVGVSLAVTPLHIPDWIVVENYAFREPAVSGYAVAIPSVTGYALVQPSVAGYTFEPQ